METENENTQKQVARKRISDYSDDIPFAWKHIILVDKHSHAGRVVTKIKQEIKSESKNLEKNG